MKSLKSIRLPDGIVLAWIAPDWVKQILPADSVKKRALSWLVTSGVIRPFQKNFGGSLLFGGRNLDLRAILEELSSSCPDCTPVAIYANARRHPPRLYVWLEMDGGWGFLKVGNLSDARAFRNEVAICSDLELEPGFRVARPLACGEAQGMSYLLVQGLSPDELAARRSITPHELLTMMQRSDTARRGVFGGAVHGDLSSSNVFRIGDEILVVDWEFAAQWGPDFCDAVCLAAATDAVGEVSVDSVDGILNKEFSFGVTRQELMTSLEFLATRGNPHALNAITGGN